MSDYRIVCVNRLDTGPEHCHVTDIGTETLGGRTRRWSTHDVRAAIANGERFYTISLSTNTTADVDAYDCSYGLKTIRSYPDAAADNNLDGLPECPHVQQRSYPIEVTR
jgi:hypothetical protein